MGSLFLLPLLILANAFFVSGEYIVIAIRRPQIAEMERRKWRSASYMAKLRADLAATLGGIQVCITMTNLLLGWVGEPAMTRILLKVLSPLEMVIPEMVARGFSTICAFVIVTLLTVILSELLPKAMTLQHTMLIARVVSGPLVLVLHFIRPLVWVMDHSANLLSRMMGLGEVKIEDLPASIDELKAIARDAGERGTLGAKEQTLIINTLGLSKIRAEDVMIPRVKIAYLDLQRSMEQNREVMEQYLYSRLPLCNGSVDRVVGLVYTKEFLAAYAEAADTSVLQLIARPAVFAPSTVSLDRLLDLFLEKDSRMIILVDEYGGVDGLVTLADVMRQLLQGECDETN